MLGWLYASMDLLCSGRLMVDKEHDRRDRGYL